MGKLTQAWQEQQSINEKEDEEGANDPRNYPPLRTEDFIGLHLAECESTKQKISKVLEGPCPWMTESDRLEFMHAGYSCLLLRNPRLLHWCAYVGVPNTHPLYDDDSEHVPLEVHGGITYRSHCKGAVCHLPKPGEEDDLFWLGFDCAHFGDYVPGLDAALKEVGKRKPETVKMTEGLDVFSDNSTRYRDLKWVMEETRELAEQLRRIEVKGK